MAATLKAQPVNRLNRQRNDKADRRRRPEAPLGERARARKLLGREIDFIANRSFQAPGTGEAIAKVLPAEIRCLVRDVFRVCGRLSVPAVAAAPPWDDVQPQELTASVPAAEARGALRDLPAHLARLCEAQLLSPDEERDLFRGLNFLKYQANALRSTLDPRDPDIAVLDAVESCLEAARLVRDRIIQANMRLVISVVKKFVNPQHSFDELLSDGIMSLMQAVDKFDYDRGFRFSTYAYRAIARNAFRRITDRRRDLVRNASDAGDAPLEMVADDSSEGLNETAWVRIRDQLGSMLASLDRRERFIIRNRFALGYHRRAHTFQSLADRLGVSKERVRQLEQRAMLKLRKLASEAKLDELMEPMFAG